MQQAARVSDYTGFFLLGELIEFGKTQDIFTAPTNIFDNNIFDNKMKKPKQ